MKLSTFSKYVPLRCIILLSTYAVTVSLYEIKTIPEDQEHAEKVFLNPDEKSKNSKTCLNKRLRNQTNVCDVKEDIFLQICEEVIEWENIRHLSLNYKLNPNATSEECKEGTLEFYRVKTISIEPQVNARKCPTIPNDHELWISRGHEVGSVFVYSRNVDDHHHRNLRLEDYIVFIDSA